jgi:molecular chaperone DnaK (HSP70)
VSHMLRENAIRGKEQLSKLEQTKIPCCTGKFQDIDRTVFNKATAARLAQVEYVLRSVLAAEQQRQEKLVQEGKRPKVVGPDRVLLAGGASNMPQVKQLVKEITGMEPLIHKSLEKIVAIGAAYEAAIMLGLVKISIRDDKGEPTGDDVSLSPSRNIVTANIGIKAYNSYTGKYENAIVIERNTLEGEEKTRDDLSPKDPGQTSVRFVLLEGDSTSAEECAEIGSAELNFQQREPDVRLRVILKVGQNYTVEGRGIAYKVVQESGEDKVVIVGETPLRLKRKTGL